MVVVTTCLMLNVPFSLTGDSTCFQRHSDGEKASGERTGYALRGEAVAVAGE
jgi:hypothetical protein